MANATTKWEQIQHGKLVESIMRDMGFNAVTMKTKSGAIIVNVWLSNRRVSVMEIQRAVYQAELPIAQQSITRIYGSQVAINITDNC